ncbi:MAG: hypothetical protein OCD02_14800 [Spirochaetaceae bacterium]
MDISKYLTNYIGYIVNDKQTILPLETDKGDVIKWLVVSGSAQIQGDKILKLESAKENEVITLKATISDQEFFFRDIILKDEYVAHLMTYFNHDEGKKSGRNPDAGLRLAYSYDGLDWEPLNNGKSVVNATLGKTNWLRDPNTFRMRDGSFGIVATQGWDTPYIFYFHSHDMITFNEKIIRISRKGAVDNNPHHKLTGKRVWAPKAYYDIEKDRYIILWSDPSHPWKSRTDDKTSRPIYCTITEDFISISGPLSFFETEFPLIDASISKDKGYYYLFCKDERSGKKNIIMAKSQTLTPGSFKLENICVTDPNDFVEGPFAFKSLKDGKWYLYYDDFQHTHTYKYSSSDSLDTEWKHHGINKQLPIKKLDYQSRISHGGHIEVTQKELECIIKKYQDREMDLPLNR